MKMDAVTTTSSRKGKLRNGKAPRLGRADRSALGRWFWGTSAFTLRAVGSGELALEPEPAGGRSARFLPNPDGSWTGQDGGYFAGETLRIRWDGPGGSVQSQPVSLDLASGQVLAVLGPSGCGKSTLLRAVAGLEPLASGSVSWDGADLAGTPTHKRGFALMFQDGQLFAHLTVARNVAYALRLRRTPSARVAARVRELLALVGLEGYDDRLPGTLSGGERQRVALARALADSV